MNKITVKKRKPQKNEFINNHCIAILSPDTSIENNNVTGVVNFIQKSSHLEIQFKIKDGTKTNNTFNDIVDLKVDLDYVEDGD